MNIHDFIAKGNELTPDIIDRLAAIDWSIYNDENGYVDIDFVQKYKEGTLNSPMKTYNLHATFRLEDQALYFVLGKNHGDGVDIFFEYEPEGNYVNYAGMFEQALKNNTNSVVADVAILIEKYPECLQSCLTALSQFEQLMNEEAF